MTRESIISKIKSLLTITEKGSGASSGSLRVAAAKAREHFSQYIRR